MGAGLSATAERAAERDAERGTDARGTDAASPHGAPSPNGAVPPNGAPSPNGAARPAPAARPGLTLFELARLEEARRAAADVEASVRASGGAPAAAHVGWTQRVRGWAQGAAVALAAVAAVYAYQTMRGPALASSVAPRAVVEAPAPDGVSSGTVGSADPAAVPVRVPVRVAFGRSAGVYVRVAVPGQTVEYPIALAAPRAAVRYQWLRAADGSAATGEQPLTGKVVVAPTRPGLYHLALASGPLGPAAAHRVLDDVTLAVLTPFAEKLGGVLNGYRIGRYPFESFGGERPLGFVEVTAGTARLPLSQHTRLEDFITHDGQRQWPRYVAVSPQLLDKIELVIAEVARVRGVDPGRIGVSVHSGFRTPSHNGGVEGAAFNSRHQYGDAADVAVDADGDGRYSALDAQWAGLAAEMVERRHPELTGGLGMYTSAAAPYVHIDVRGRKARWWKR